MAAGRLYDDLCENFNRRCIFRDIHSINPGEPYRDVLREALGMTSVLLILIGPRWDVSRLQENGDSVSLEIETAIGRQIRIIPILVEGGNMPKRHELPQPISSLVDFQWIKIAEDRWEQDLSILADHIERQGFNRHKVTKSNLLLQRSLLAFVVALTFLVPWLLLNESNGLIAQGQLLADHSPIGSFWWKTGSLCQAAQGHFVDFINFQYAMYGVLVAYFAFSILGRIVNLWSILHVFGLWFATYFLARVSTESWRKDSDVMFRVGATVGCIYVISQLIRKLHGKLAR